jgi:hypothetical protein
MADLQAEIFTDNEKNFVLIYATSLSPNRRRNHRFEDAKKPKNEYLRFRVIGLFSAPARERIATLRRRW